VSIAMVVYDAGLLGAKYLIAQGGVSEPLAFALALVPGLAVVGLFYAVGMLIVEQTDEFLRMLLVRQNLIAIGFALSLASVWGFLEAFDLVPHIAAFYIVVVWAVGLLLGGAVNRVTHGTWGNCW
jgi:hypothetical protein